MGTIRRMLLVGLLLPGSIVQAGWARAAPEAGTTARGGKTVKDCNEELGRATVALEAAGESASAFFHACWFHSEKGRPTPIVAKGEGIAPPDGRPAPTSSVAGSVANEAEGRRAERRAARHAARGRRRAYRVAMRRHREEAAGIDEAAVALPDMIPDAVRPEATRLPGHVNVGVPLVGIMAVPILPGLEAAVQDVVAHPLVPGLATTSP